MGDESGQQDLDAFYRLLGADQPDKVVIKSADSGGDDAKDKAPMLLEVLLACACKLCLVANASAGRQGCLVYACSHCPGFSQLGMLASHPTRCPSS